MTSFAERFWRKVNRGCENECWLWTASVFKDGYGQFSDSRGPRRRNRRVNRVVWELEHGEEPPESMLVRHTCDNRRCCNPRHLVLGTHQDNMDDMVQRDRQAKGKQQGISRLTAAKVRVIRRLKATHTHQQLADKFSISYGTVRDVVYRRTWKHVN